MKKWKVIFAVIITVFIMLYAGVYFFIIPKAATLALPPKWKNVVPGLKKPQYAMYLGKPEMITAASGNDDQWTTRSGNYTFVLTIHYSSDSVASNVQLSYAFSNLFFNKNGKLYNNEEN